MPSITRSVQVTLPEAVLLADLYEIASELRIAADYCTRAMQSGSQEIRDWVLEEALVSAAVVKYGRCFTTGVRLSLSTSDVSSLGESLCSRHEYYLAVRNKFVAHAVNAFEETFVTVGAREVDGVRLSPQSINAGSHRLVLSAEVAADLIGVVNAVAAMIADRVKIEESRVLAHIQSLPVDVVHDWGLRVASPVSPDQVHMSRSRGTNARGKE